MGTLAPVLRICGRQAEIQALGEALDRVAAGGLAIGLVEGEAAVSVCARGPRPLQLALTCEDAGAAVARQGDVARAGQLLNRAITVYERLDATRDLARTEAALRQMGIRRGRRSPTAARKAAGKA